MSLTSSSLFCLLFFKVSVIGTLFLFLDWCAVCLWLLICASFWVCFLWLQKWIIKPPIKIFHFYRPDCVVVVTACNFWCCHSVIKHTAMKNISPLTVCLLDGNYIQGTELEMQTHSHRRNTPLVIFWHFVWELCPPGFCATSILRPIYN